MLEAKDIDLNLLVVFQEVFEMRKISAVARKLNLSQPAVSNALARLRKTFGDELFVRTSSGMQPTPLAQQLADPVASALSSITKALNQQESFSPASSERHFTIAMTDVGEVHFMPRLVQQCLRFAPQVHLSTVRTSTNDLMAAMETGHIDLAIGAFETVSGALYQRRLFQQNLVCMFRKNHPFLSNKMNAIEFREAQHLIVSTNESPYNKINQSLEKAGVKIVSQFTVPHFSAAPYIVASTDLLATVPEKLAQSAAQPFGLQYIKPPIKMPTLQTNIFWHRRFSEDEGNQWLRGLIVEHFSDTSI